MTERASIAHGGALQAAMRAFPDAPKPWLDLSTGINPVPYPVAPIAPARWMRLPEREDVAALEAAAAQSYDVPDATCVVAAPGAQSLIQVLPALFPARNVAVLGPTYAEHAHRWRLSGADTTIVGSLEAINAVDVAIIVNPNNPDGRVFAADKLEPLAHTLSARGTLLVIDESFADVAPAGVSFAPRVAAHRAIVLRSFGKFYGLAGLRLGFAVAPPALAERLRDALGPWAVSGPAIAIGTDALRDKQWQAATRVRLARDAARLEALLKAHDLRSLGGTTLFRLAAHADAAALHRHLCANGILTRVFPSEPTFIRFGLPDGSEAAWDRLTSALASAR